LDLDEAALEIDASRTAIAEELGTEAAHLAYRFGNSSEAVRALAAEAGFADVG
jgi:hypothetical protein